MKWPLKCPSRWPFQAFFELFSQGPLHNGPLMALVMALAKSVDDIYLLIMFFNQGPLGPLKG